ncbi:hypothetical protein PLEOSDRAFT_174056 [Pleurotus ostreatus PC15]|uniref:Uncharacterized protein n=1 Tax=Pleurotus ostreatus (strain PC15) TaxID=1137138 RepID=A0A067NFE2_PLEO1|nr:hypothetical protein PLEOSDRAFT_174056 [Pleurotus ostreatus PC15]
MRLSGIFKSFLHRRTKSCPTDLPSMVSPAALEPIRVAAEAPAAYGARTPLIDQVFATARARHSDSAVETLKKSPASDDRVQLLQSELARMRATHAHFASGMKMLQDEIAASKDELASERLRHATTLRRLEEQQIEVSKAQDRLGQLERFTARLVDGGSKTSVLYRARGMILDGEDTEVALVLAIKEVASDPASPWRLILDAVNGPRTQDEYLSAINMTLSTRKALRESKKISKFWKGVAMEDGTHENVITPSPSNISSIHETLSTERQAAVDLLIKRRKNADLPPSQPLSPVRQRKDCFERNKMKTLSRMVEPSSSSRSFPSSFPSDGSSSSVLALAPLASQVFKEELMSSHSSRKLLKSVSRSSGSIAITISTSSISALDSDSPDKTIEEWTLVESTETRSSADASQTSKPDFFANLLTSHLLSTDTRVEDALRSEKVSRVRLSGGPQPFDNSAFATLMTAAASHGSVRIDDVCEVTWVTREEVPLPGALESAQALSSLERICATIRSGSELGSLETISERTEPESECDRDYEHISSSDITSTPARTASTVATTSPSRLPIFKAAKQPHNLPKPVDQPNFPPFELPILTIPTAPIPERVIEEPKVKKGRMSLIPRNTNKSAATPKPLKSALKPCQPKRAPGSAVGSETKSPTPHKNIRRRGSNANSGSKENDIGSQVMSKGKKVIRGLHRAMS